MSFATDQIALLANSGWATCTSIATAITEAGLPAITSDYLATAFSAKQWHAAEKAVYVLGEHFATARFADEVDYGILLVPDPAKLDTRQPQNAALRRDQLDQPLDDVFDERLPAGVLGVCSGSPWNMVATVTGRYGPALGSHNQVVNAPAEMFTVAGADTRRLMIRQIWGARILQSGRDLPDCEANQRWTFTLFPGEGLSDGCAASGTVLKGRVRFRLGKPDRGIGSARLAPALLIS